MADFWIKRNDTAPILTATLADSAGNAVDLTGATVRFHMTDPQFATKVDASATVTDALNGKVKYEWQAGDTDTAGSYIAEWEVTYSTGNIETFPSDFYFEIEVDRDLM